MYGWSFHAKEPLPQRYAADDAELTSPRQHPANGLLCEVFDALGDVQVRYASNPDRLIPFPRSD